LTGTTDLLAAFSPQLKPFVSDAALGVSALKTGCSPPWACKRQTFFLKSVIRLFENC
jgi:hypothetical protein